MNIINNIWNCLMLWFKKVKTGRLLTITGKIYIHGEKGRVTIGDNVIINSRFISNPIAGGNHTHLRAEKNGHISIGNDVGMSHVNIISYSDIVIEDNVMLGSCVKIWDTDFHPLVYKERVDGNNANVISKPIKVKEGAFIGACSIILKGVTIGRHSIIGAGSVVAKDVPDGEIWAGNPARFIRRVEV